MVIGNRVDIIKNNRSPVLLAVPSYYCSIVVSQDINHINSIRNILLCIGYKDLTRKQLIQSIKHIDYFCNKPMQTDLR